ncbi:MAG: hypothetical protein ACT4QC_06555 [Planctomycetaceae bacterium]
MDQQIVVQHCDECAVDYTVIRGSIFDEGNPFGLYLIALHGHCSQGKLGHLAIGVRAQADADDAKSAAAIQIIGMPDQSCFSFTDWDDSPWKDESYLGVMYGRESALASSLKPLFLHVAEHVVNDLPGVRDYFS